MPLQVLVANTALPQRWRVPVAKPRVKLQFGDTNDDDLRSFDYGVNALAGLEIDRVMLDVNYGLGMSKIVPNSDDFRNDKNKYRVLSVNVGFRF